MLMTRFCLHQQLTNVRSCGLPPRAASQRKSPDSIRRFRLAISHPNSCPMAATFSSWLMAARQHQEFISEHWMEGYRNG